MAWSKVNITKADGERVEAQAPVIVSASRATDIPAFYSDWLMERVRAGYVRWSNPFNGKPLYVSFARTRVFVFWSKNPAPLLKHLDWFDDQGYGYYFQFTLNDYEAEGLEPNVPSLSERIDTFIRLSERIGKEKVIWRFDPLVLTATTGVDELLEKAAYIGHRLKEHTDKLVFSFADIGTYTRVKNNLAKDAIPYREFDRQTMEELAAGICRLNESWHLQLATCAEAIPLESYGILHNKCVDDDLLIKLFPHDKALMDSLGVQITIPDLFHQEPIVDKREKNRKDPGQREACRCVMSKDIGEYNTCPHLCKYCYANASAEAAWRNWQHHLEHPHAETIKGTY